VVVGSAVAMPPAQCPATPLEVVISDPAALALVSLDACTTFGVAVRTGDGDIRLGSVEMIVDTIAGPISICAFDGTVTNPDPTCAPRSLCTAPGASERVRSVVGALGCSRCGDGVVDANEECDDGNTSGGDGCSETCTFEDLDHDGVRDVDDACLGTQVPERVPTQHLNPQRYALLSGTRASDGTLLFDYDARGNGNGKKTSTAKMLTTGLTRGCSCDQMLTALGVREGDEQRSGCSGTTVQRWTGIGGW
jgi:cysteine-rich repeat protein